MYMNNVDYVEMIIQRLRDCFVPEWALEPLESWVEQERQRRKEEGAPQNPIPQIIHTKDDKDGNEICPKCLQRLKDLPRNDIGRYCVHGNWQIGEHSIAKEDESPRHYAYVSNY